MTQVEQMTELILRSWRDSFSDNGAVWRKSQDELDRAKASAPGDVYREALALAKARFPTSR